MSNEQTNSQRQIYINSQIFEVSICKVKATLFLFLILYGVYLGADPVNINNMDIIKSAPLEILPFVDEIKKNAETGDPIDQLRLSVLYSRGIGVDKDPIAARTWLTKSADNGNPDANYFLGQMYLFSTGSAQNKIEAIRRFKKSADGKHVKGAQLAGSMLYGMYGGEFIDLPEAKKFLTEAFDGGDPLSSFLLTCLYRYDLNDHATAERYLEESIAREYPAAKSYSISPSEDYLKNKCSEFRRK